MLQNAYFLAKIGADTAENEQHFAEILPKIGNSQAALPRGSFDRLLRHGLLCLDPGAGLNGSCNCVFENRGGKQGTLGG